ncbi:MAG: sporulation integral membrane protein YlbJ [Syntrophomonadaceae bacterium]|nr:sporulation integral membrane protein YlbJ [Syntrophomonadaceae bacterium]
MNMFFIIFVLLTTLFMVINPQETVNAASAGIQLWYMVVLPALLPFFIMSELLVNLGVIHLLGVMLEPIMRPLFKLPGSSSLVIAMGFTSGFPIGAVLTKKLYEQKLLTADEAERLVSFTNNSSPLFILGAVGVGMFGYAPFGYLLAASHYISNLIVGIIWGLKSGHTSKISKQQSSLAIAAKQVFRSRISIGKLLGDSIRNSINNIIAIAGFILLFCVVTRMLTIWGIMDQIALAIMKTTSFLGITYPQAYGLGMGIFEMTIGLKTLISSQGNLLTTLIAASMLMGFSGFSIIAQVMGFMTGTPVRLSFYLLSRLVQITLSTLITIAGYYLFFAKKTVQSWSGLNHPAFYSFDAWSISIYCLVLGLGIIAVMILISQFIKD